MPSDPPIFLQFQCAAIYHETLVKSVAKKERSAVGEARQINQFSIVYGIVYRTPNLK
jgi:hypothetical protein